MANTSTHKNVWCIAEIRQGKISSALPELITAGQQTAKDLGENLHLVLIGKDIQTHAEQVKTDGVEKIWCIDHADLESFREDLYAAALLPLLEQEKPNKIFLPGNVFGKSLAPRLAVGLKTGLVSDASEITVDAGTLKIKRVCNGGTSQMTVTCPNSRPEIATLRPGAFAKANLGSGNTELTPISPDLSNAPTKTCYTQFEPETSQEKDIAQADVVVSGGYGLGGPDGFKPLQELADKLKGAVGASRRAVDAGWIPYAHQVGLTGKIVRPKLYMACAISGQVQHLAGMSQSQNIVAINKDPEAPMMQLADFSVEADALELIPAVIQELSS